jgi:hypothetical protein
MKESKTANSELFGKMGLLGFTSYYREGFTVVLFLQSYRPKLVAQSCYRAPSWPPLNWDYSDPQFHGAPPIALQEKAGVDGCNARIRSTSDGGRARAANATRAFVADQRDNMVQRRHSVVDGNVTLDIPHFRDAERPSHCKSSCFLLVRCCSGFNRRCTFQRERASVAETHVLQGS